jgi:hypothetical protein
VTARPTRTITVRLVADGGTLHVRGADAVRVGCHVVLDLGTVNRYGWRLAVALAELHDAATFEVRGGARDDVRAAAARFLIANGKTLISVEGITSDKLDHVSLERPQSRASKGDSRWERR